MGLCLAISAGAREVCVDAGQCKTVKDDWLYPLPKGTPASSWQVVGAIPGRRAGAEAGPRTATRTAELEATDGVEVGVDSPASRKESDRPGSGLGSDLMRLKIREQCTSSLWASIFSVLVMNARLKADPPSSKF